MAVRNIFVERNMVRVRGLGIKKHSKLREVLDGDLVGVGSEAADTLVIV